MSWTAERSGKDVNVSGPVGDTLSISVTSTDTSFVWNTGWTWLGQVRQSPSTAVVSTFTFTDTSTATALNLVAKVADTSAWTSADAMVYAIQGTKSSETYTFLSGKVVPTDDIAHA
jgi:putative flippase GtrA